MSEFNIIKIEKKVKKALDKERYRHTLGVAYTSAALAMRYGYDIEKAQVAGLLHDCAKAIPNKEKLSLCEKYAIIITEFEQNNPFILHAKLGAYLAEVEYGINDAEILSAIRYHTTGRQDMSILEKIVYTADYIEPMRCQSDNLQEIRQMAFVDIDKALYHILKDILCFLENSTTNIDPLTREAYDYYKK